MEHLEVMPISSRVVCLNAPYLKSLCVFEALSRTLGCYYNHHRPQVVSCYATVRLPAPRIVKVRGHASHTHTPCDTPTIQTFIQMGTYLVFYLKDWSAIHKCHLIINGIEKLSKAKAPVPPKILLERIIDTDVLPTTGDKEQDKNLTNKSLNNGQNVTKVNEPHSTQNATILNKTIFSNTSNITRLKEALFPNDRTSDKVYNANTLPKPRTQQNRTPVSDKNKCNAAMQHTKSSPLQNIKAQSIDNYPTRLQDERMNISEEDNNELHNPRTIITINMDQSEEITTLLDDDNDVDSEYSSDTSDDLHKVVRKRLSVDITSLIHSCPNNNILVLLMRPAEETQGWQFLSACMKVTHYSTKALVSEGTGTIKKALTRTRPIYFSKNGNAQRL